MHRVVGDQIDDYYPFIYLHWGEEQIDTRTGAVMVRESGNAFVHVREVNKADFEIVEHDADGNVTVLALIPHTERNWIRELREVDGQIEYRKSAKSAFVRLDPVSAS